MDCKDCLYVGQVMGTVGHSFHDDQVLRTRQGDPGATYLNPYHPDDGLFFERQGTEDYISVSAAGFVAH